MFPVLLRLGNFQLYSYGVMLFISFILGIAIVESRAKRFGVDPKKITDFGFVGASGGGFGGATFFMWRFTGRSSVTI